MHQNHTENNTCGSVPSVLSRFNSSSPVSARAGGIPERKNSADIYNISTTTIPKNKGRKQRTKNRKYITHSSTIQWDGVSYEVNNGKSGMYSKIIHRAIDELEKSIGLWCRVLVLRFDLHHKGITTPNNKWLSRMFKNLKRKVERKYGLNDMGYVWVREHERGKAQHYHAVIFIDGDVVRHPEKLRELITETWEAINPVNTVYYPANQFYFVDSEEVKKDVVYRLSYMAKVRGKGYRNNQTKDFFCSNLKGSK